MDGIYEQPFVGLDDGWHVVRVVARLTLAVILGAALGYEREKVGKAAGLRTHMLVTIGAALFVLVPLEGGVKLEHLTRVIQGLAAGIGFLGAGAILKLSEQRRIQGLTTAANIWVAAAVGLAVGMGLIVPALASVLLALLILHVLSWFEPPNRKS